MSEHSPEPWTLTELRPEEGEQEPCYRLEAESTLFVTIAPCSDGFKFGQNQANAYLLWSSPDMHTALVETEELLGFHEGSQQLPDDGAGSDHVVTINADDFYRVLSTVRTALAKAKAGPPYGRIGHIPH